MRRLARIWNGFWFIEGPAHGMAVFRILLSLYLLWRWLVLAPYVRLLFSGEGMYMPFIDRGDRNLDLVSRLFAAFTGPLPPWLAWLIYLLTITALLGMALGRFTRTSIGLFCAMYVYYYLLYMHPLNSSFDRTVVITVGLLALGPSGKALSLDAWSAARRGRDLGNVHPLWTQRAICFQIAFMYFGTGVFKIFSDSWKSGDMLYTSLMSDWSTPLSWWLLKLDLPLGVFDLATLATIVFELWACLLLFHPRWQWPVFAVGFLFHLGIALFLSIWQFMFMPLSYVLFVDPRRVESWFGRHGDRRERGVLTEPAGPSTAA